MPIFYWISQWFVDRGHVVVLPQRRGHGASGGIYAEGLDSCGSPRHLEMGAAAADDIEAVLNYMRREPFVDPDHITIVGSSSGGWASLALSARNPQGVKLVVNFAGGRGAYAFGRAGAICAEDQLIAAASSFASTARIPTVWLYAENDSYFSPDLGRRMAAAWSKAGGRAKFHLLPALGREGHGIANSPAGRQAWEPILSPYVAAAATAP